MNSKLTNANNQNLGSDMARVDAHEIRPQEYDELPELAEADLARGVWKIAGKEVTPAEGKAAFSSALKKQKINLALDPDVLGWAGIARRLVAVAIRRLSMPRCAKP